MGSGLSVYGTAKFGDKIEFGSAGNTYATLDSSVVKFYVGGTKSLTIESDGGILHGSWATDNQIAVSDRRLKREITPLQRTLRNIMPVAAEEAKERHLKVAELTSKPTEKAPAGSDGALWLLRQLRPVSYSFRSGAESKYMRFGFIADELESVVPQVVRTTGNRELEDQKSVVYQDLIALLASAAQSQQKRLDQQQTQLEELTSVIKEMRTELKYLREAKQEERETRVSLRSRRSKKKQRRT